MKNTGLGCMNAFAIVGYGSSRETEKGDLALSALQATEHEGKLRAIRGIEKSVVAEQMLPQGKFDRDLEQLMFIRAPNVEGPTKAVSKEVAGESVEYSTYYMH